MSWFGIAVFGAFAVPAAAVAPGAAWFSEFPAGQQSDDMEVTFQWLTIPTKSYNPLSSKASAVYASQQFLFESNVIGYMGSQVKNGLWGLESTFLFSAWDASPYQKSTGVGANCARFGNEGTGSHCQLHSLPIIVGHQYKVRLAFSSPNFLQGTVEDMSGGRSYHIGTLHLPNAKGFSGFGKFHPTTAPGFLEYWLAAGSSCGSMSKSQVMITGPLFQGGRLLPNKATPSYNSNYHCPPYGVTSSVTGRGIPKVLMELGAGVRRVNKDGDSLWVGGGGSSPGHSAGCRDSDPNCPTAYRQYCNTAHIRSVCPKTCGACASNETLLV